MGHEVGQRNRLHYRKINEFLTQQSSRSAFGGRLTFSLGLAENVKHFRFAASGSHISRPLRVLRANTVSSRNLIGRNGNNVKRSASRSEPNHSLRNQCTHQYQGLLQGSAPRRFALYVRRRRRRLQVSRSRGETRLLSSESQPSFSSVPRGRSSRVARYIGARIRRFLVSMSRVSYHRVRPNPLQGLPT